MRLIDADELIKSIKDLPNCKNGYSDTYDKACIIGMIEDAPTIEAEPVRHGYWSHKQVDTTLYHVYGQCSECKERHRIDNYCSSCGAKME